MKKLTAETVDDAGTVLCVCRTYLLSELKDCRLTAVLLVTAAVQSDCSSSASLSTLHLGQLQVVLSYSCIVVVNV